MNKFIVVYKNHFSKETYTKIFETYKSARAFVDEITIKGYDEIYLTQVILSIVSEYVNYDLSLEANDVL